LGNCDQRCVVQECKLHQTWSNFRIGKSDLDGKHVPERCNNSVLPGRTDNNRNAVLAPKCLPERRSGAFWHHYTTGFEIADEWPDHTQTIFTLLHRDNHDSTSTLNFHRTDALPHTKAGSLINGIKALKVKIHWFTSASEVMTLPLTVLYKYVYYNNSVKPQGCEHYSTDCCNLSTAFGMVLT